MMGKILEKPVVVILLLLVLSIYLFFFHSGRMALTDPDETFYAQAAKEMIQKGEWLTPMLYGKPQFEKPILFYWLLEASYKAFGINEFAARFPSGLFGFLGLAAIYLLGRLLFNNRVGVFSAIALATNLEYLMLANACVTDMALSTLMLLGVLFFFYGQIRKKDYFYVLSSAAFAFAALTKGPIGILLPCFIIFVYLLLTKDSALLKKLKPILLSSVVFVLIALPWYIVMYKLHANSFLDEFFGFHNITRFLTPEHKIGSGIYYNIPIVFGGFFPWSAFLPFGFWQMFKSKERRASLFILLWFFIIFIFFSVSSTKLPTYIFPSFISLALIVGKLWDDFLNKHNEKWFFFGMRLSYFLLLSATALSLIGAYIFIRMDYPEIVPGMLIAGLFLVLGMGLSLIAFLAKKFLAVFILVAYSVALILYPVVTLALPLLEGYETDRPVCGIIMSHYKEGDVIASEKDFRPGVAFYTGVIPAYLSNSSNLLSYIREGRTVWGVLKQKNIVEDMNIVYKRGKKRLVTNSKEKAT